MNLGLPEFGAGAYLMLGTAVSTALFHTLIPDHWLPFVFAGKARNWSAGHTAAISGVSALIHAGLSLILAFGGLLVGREAAHAVGESLETAGGILLVLFGLAYAGWAWKKGGHFHPGGKLFHTAHEGPECSGHEGDANPEHMHYHADREMLSAPGGPGGWTLALIIGINPCILILPVILASVEHGAGTVFMVAGAYSITTTGLMVGLSVLGVAGSRRLLVPAVARYMESISGLLIALTGVIVMLLPH